MGALAPSGWAAAADPLPVRDGDAGEVFFSLENLPASTGTIFGAGVEFNELPGFNLVAPALADIPAASAHEFSLSYLIDGNAVEGVSTVTFRLNAETRNVRPGFSNFDQSVRFHVDRTAPAVTVLDLAGKQAPPFGQGYVIRSPVKVKATDAGTKLQRLTVAPLGDFPAGRKVMSVLLPEPSTAAERAFPPAGGLPELPSGLWAMSAEDIAGNASTVTVNVDSVDPAFLFFEPDDGAVLKPGQPVTLVAILKDDYSGFDLESTTTFKVRFNDAEFGEVLVGVPEDATPEEVARNLRASFTFPLTPLLAPSTAQHLTVVASDRAGRKIIKTVVFRIENDSDPPTLTVFEGAPAGRLQRSTTEQFFGEVEKIHWLGNGLVTGGSTEEGTDPVGLLFQAQDDLSNMGETLLESLTGSTTMGISAQYPTKTAVATVHASILPDAPSFSRGETGSDPYYSIRAVDRQGNATRLRFNVDSIPPKVEYSLRMSRFDVGGGTKNILVEVDATALDDGSGVGYLDVHRTTISIVPPFRGEARRDITKVLSQSPSLHPLDPEVEQTQYVIAADGARFVSDFNPISLYRMRISDRAIPRNQGWFKMTGTGELANWIRSARMLGACIPDLQGGCAGTATSHLYVRWKQGERQDDATIDPEPPSVTPGVEKLVHTFSAGGPTVPAPVELDLMVGGNLEFKVEGDADIGIDIDVIGGAARKDVFTRLNPGGLDVTMDFGGAAITLRGVTAPGGRVALVEDFPILPPEGFRTPPGMPRNRGVDVIVRAQLPDGVDVSLPVLASVPQGLTNDLRLFHFRGDGQWEDVTVGVGAGHVKGRSASASPFAIFVATGAVPPDESAPVTTLDAIPDSQERGVWRSPEGHLFIGPTGRGVLNARDEDAGVLATYYAIDPPPELVAAGLNADTAGQFSEFIERLPLMEGRREVYFGSRDRANNFEALHSSVVFQDDTAPLVTFERGADKLYRINALDPTVEGASSGVGELLYLVDVDPGACGEEDDPQAPAGTCANSAYQGPFSLSVGTHTVYFTAVDNVGNGFGVVYSSFVTVAPDVPPPSLTSIAVQPASLNLAAGSSHQFKAVGTYTDSSTRTLSWTGWSPLAPMPAALGHVAGGVLDGKLHTLGGWDAGFTFQSHHFIYDPASNAWSTGTALPQPRLGGNAVAAGGRLYYLAGAAPGFAYTRELLMLDPATGQWTAKAPMPRERAFMSVGVIGGKIYAAGGFTGSAVDDQLWVYDPAADSWSVKAPIPESHYVGFSGVINGRFYLFGGQGNAGLVLRGYAYDPPTDTWTEVAPLPTWRYGGASGVAAVSAVWDGKLYAIGGLPQGTDQPLRLVEVYDPVTNSWSRGSDAIEGPWGGPATGVIDGAIYVAGGGEAGRTTAFAQGLGGGDVAWSVDAPAVATATASGFVTGLVPGSARVYASTGAVAGFSELTVYPTFFVAASPDGGASLGSGNEEQVVTPVSTQTASVAYAAAVGTQGLALASPAFYEITPSPVVFDPPALLTMTFDPTLVDTNTVAIYRYQDPLWSSAPVANQTVTILGPNLAQVSGYLSSASMYAAFSLPVRGPDVALHDPAPGALEVESAVGGVVRVRGVVGEGAVAWTLSVGTNTVATGEGPAAGELASFDSAPFPGARTLTLSARNASGAVSSTAAAVHVGAPSFTLSLGRKDSDVVVAPLEKPSALAVRSDGELWVSVEEELLRLKPDGTVLARVGRRETGHGHDDDDEDDDGPVAGLSVKRPRGLALDAEQNLYVADEGHDRVLKLSADGSQLLLSLGRVHKGKPKKGTGPGEFHAPWDVAVDGNGDLYVLEKGNRRVQVFDASGAFLRSFGPGVFGEESELRGLALSAEGVWVSDKERGEVLLLSREGALLGKVGDADSVVGELSRTRGVATDRFGALYVAETSRDRVQKFDPKGHGLLAFGSRSAATPAEREAKRFLSEPLDAALGPDGALWVADTGRDRVIRYALPAQGGVAAAAAPSRGRGRAAPASRRVEAKDGARVERDDGTGVSVPQDALAADLDITVDAADEAQDAVPKQASRAQKKIQPASEEVEYGPEGTRFSKPVTLTIAYAPAPGLDESKLKVHYWNPLTKEWEALDSVVDTRAKTVSAQTTHFSVYQVQGAGSGFVPAAAVDEFGLRDQYAFPNPSRRGQAVTFRVQPGLADSVELRVYDLSGRKVHESSAFSLVSAFDDGNGKGPQHTYDHVWGVGGVGSGVYYYVITAKKAGQSDITAKGKVGVIK